MSDPLFLSVGFHIVCVLLNIDLVLDNPFTILCETFKAVYHMGDAMFNSLPGIPRLNSEPLKKDTHSTRLSFGEASNFEHNSVQISSNCHVEKEFQGVPLRVLKPLVGPLSDGLAGINLLIPIVIVERISRLLIFSSSIVLSLLLKSIESQLLALLLTSYFLL